MRGKKSAVSSTNPVPGINWQYQVTLPAYWLRVIPIERHSFFCADVIKNHNAINEPGL